MKIVEIEGLSKNFGSIFALDNVSLTIEEGETLGLLGPNGAGKTTLLRIMNGIMVKDKGDVKIMGEEASLKVSRSIGYMPEERGLYDNMTVENQIIYFGQLKGAREADIRPIMNEYLSLFNLDGAHKRKVKELSKGNQQKVQIICTLVHRPKLVILDEPFSGFDPINGAILQKLIQKLKEQNTSIIISSHNMHAVEELCDSIALINHGQLILRGKLDEIKHQHKKGVFFINTSQRINLGEIGETGKVEWINQIVAPKGLSGYSYQFKKNENVQNIDILREFAQQSEINKFEEQLPSLNEIFISLVSED